MKNSLISIYLILIIMMILPFESKSDETYQEEGTNFFNVKPASYWKDLNIINIKVNSSNNGDVRVVITTPEPYFKGTGAYGGDLIFQTPVKMMKDFYKEDLFSISILFKETEIKYLSKFKSVGCSSFMTTSYLNCLG
jgi:hypothetical protein